MVRRLSFNNKWVTTAASIWIQCIVGASYTFGIYSSALKSSQGYNQSTLDTVSVFKDIGANAGILSGLLYDAVTTQRWRSSFLGRWFSGPWVVLATGAAQFFVGYFFMWAAVAGLISRPPVIVMCLFMFFGAHGQTFFNTTNVVTGAHNFSGYSGTIVGIMKGFLGLSGAIQVQFYNILCRDNPSNFLLMLALLPTLVSMVLLSLVRIHEANKGDERKYLNAFSVVALVIVVYLMIIIILENVLTLSMWSRISIFVLLLILLSSPLGIAIKAQCEESKLAATTSSTDTNPLLEKFFASTSSTSSAHEESSLNYPEELPTSDQGQVKVASDSTLQHYEEEEEVEMNLLKAMSTVNFWLLFLAMFSGMGAGVATINNMNQLGNSFGYTTLEITSFVSLWSIWNFLGRLGAGYLSDFLLHTRGWARPLLIAITQGIMAVGHIVIASGVQGNLYVGSILVGICYGAQWSLMPTICKEIFGIRHMGTIFNTIAIASPVGSYIYSALKTTQHYDQSTLDTIAVFKDIGVNCGLLSALLYSYATCDTATTSFYRRGPWLVLLAGAGQCFLGYFLMWAAVSGLIPRPHVPVMCLFMLLAAHAQSFFNTANVVTGVRNFPRYSGTIVGIMKGFLGLSGAILVQVYQTILYNKPTSFLLMLALLPTINCLLLMWFVRIHETNEGNEKKHLNSFSLIALLLAAYLMVIIILGDVLTLGSIFRAFTFAVLILLIGSPICIAIRAWKMEFHSNGTQHPAEYHDLPSGSNQEMDADHKRTLQSGENLNLFQAMRAVDFWILFLALACGLGSGLATVNNISQIGGSLGYRNFETSSLVSLWSIWNFLGRFGAGYISDYILHVRGWARPLFMVITLAAMSVGHIVIASGLPGALYIGSVLVGVCYGSQWSLMPTIASEIFGVAHLGTIFNTITIASPVGSYIFSVRVIGYIYDKEASGEGNTCVGRHCFMLSFLIMAFATLVGSLAALGLFFRTRNFYNHVIVRRLMMHSLRE
uniref:Nodulin-like domain-containing protein n=1 Tax=Cannabis sativa TaxID=3483 RepID=A0A803P4R8_CANSA